MVNESPAGSVTCKEYASENIHFSVCLYGEGDSILIHE